MYTEGETLFYCLINESIFEVKYGSGIQIFRRRQRIMERVSEVIEQFRQKGALSPDRAIAPEELGLPPEFKEAMKRRLSQTGIFVEANGKYYLDEKRLQEMREQMANRRGFGRW